MKSKIIPLVFIVIAAALGGSFFITRNKLKNTDNTATRAKLVKPVAASVSESEESGKKTSGVETEKYETFVPLYAGETLISTLTMDFNNDAYDDEIIIVKKAGTEFLWIVPGIYDPETGDYNRFTQIQTDFSRTRTFSYSSMDIVGDHRNALIYQGINDSDDYVMKIYLYAENNGVPEVVCIGDFTSDGTIFIQQTERSESYSLSLSRGESYSVWVYKSEKKAETETDPKKAVALNQIQQEYKWNAATNHYELAQEIKVTASRLAAKELSRIQDGTVETFANFLNGLWYKTSNSDGKIRYVFFDYDKREIIQLVDDIQEVYDWDDSKLRHNGIYLTAVNSDIMNLHRRFDVSLISVDEIRITLRDDINLIISENTLWDGSYKKLSMQSSFGDAKPAPVAAYGTELKKGPEWATADSMLSITFDGICYTAKSEELMETGVYSLYNIGNYNVIQFRSDSPSSFLAEEYAMEFNLKTVTETVKRKTVEKVVTDYDSITFTPVTVTPLDCYATEGKSYSFIRSR